MPNKEDLSGPGEPRQIKGKSDVQVQVYKDRAMIEPSIKLPGGTPVGLMPLKGYVAAMIKYGDNKIGFVASGHLDIRREAGRKFTISGACDAVGLNDMGFVGSLADGEEVDVLDPKFEGGADGNLIPIAFEQLDVYKKGRVSDWNLEKA